MTPSTAVPHPPIRYPAADAGCETTMIITLLSLISGGFNEGQLALVETAANQCGVSAAYALAVLQHYAGSTVGDHFWTVRRGVRGQRIYELLTPGNEIARQTAT